MAETAGKGAANGVSWGADGGLQDSSETGESPMCIVNHGLKSLYQTNHCTELSKLINILVWPRI